MPHQTRVASPGPRPGTVRLPNGDVLSIPSDWALLPPGDAALTGRVKKAGPSWTVQEKKGNKMFSRGVWASAQGIASIRQDLLEERENPSYTRKLEAGRQKRAVEQTQYAEDFVQAVAAFLRFSVEYAGLQARLSAAIADHAVPVGSGTVARTKRIPIERRAEAATIAWLRHATTGYDQMQIPRVKGARREMRRMLAERSRKMLERYRRGERVAPEECLLLRGLLVQLSPTPNLISEDDDDLES